MGGAWCADCWGVGGASHGVGVGGSWGAILTLSNAEYKRTSNALDSKIA